MLALWEFFWTESDWTGAPVTTVIPATPGRGSGKGNGEEQPEYQLLPDEYWEEHARRHAPRPTPAPETLDERKQRLLGEVRTIVSEQTILVTLRTELEKTRQAIRDAAELEELPPLAAQVTNLKERIHNLEITNKARILRAKSLRFSLYH